jgi:hypothetical protein
MMLLGSALTDVKGGPAHEENPPAAPPEHGIAIAGTWDGRLHGIALTIALENDGTGLVNGERIRWRLRGGILSIQGPDEVQAFNVVHQDSKLILSGGDLEKSVTLSRRGGSSLKKEPPQAPPVQSKREFEASAVRNVVINGEKLSDATVGRLQQQLQVRIFDGAYWYDPACGAWGIERGPTLGFILAGLKIGGPLRADASAGTSWVYINGRQLPWQDVTALQRLGPVLPGKYWLDAAGNVGYEGSPIPIVNLVQLSAAAARRGGGSYHSRSDITGIGSGGDGRTSYVMGKDFSVIVGD